MLQTPPPPVATPHAHLYDEAMPRFDLIESVRHEIEAGHYETPEKIATLINRLTSELNLLSQ